MDRHRLMTTLFNNIIMAILVTITLLYDDKEQEENFRQTGCVEQQILELFENHYMCSIYQ